MTTKETLPSTSLGLLLINRLLFYWLADDYSVNREKNVEISLRMIHVALLLACQAVTCYH